MKKLIIAAITVISLTATAFAANISNDKVMNLFKTAYPGASNVHFKAVDDLVSVTFVLDSTNMQAFYNEEGEQVAISRTVSFQNLPLRAAASLDKKYKDYTVTEVIELDHTTDGTNYYVSLANGNQKLVARVTPNGEVSLFKKLTK